MIETPIYAELMAEFALRDRRPARDTDHDGARDGAPAAPAPDHDEPAPDHGEHP